MGIWWPDTDDLPVVVAITRQLLDEHATGKDWKTSHYREEAIRAARLGMIGNTAAYLTAAGVPSDLFVNQLSLLR